MIIGIIMLLVAGTLAGLKLAEYVTGTSVRSLTVEEVDVVALRGGIVINAWGSSCA